MSLPTRLAAAGLCLAADLARTAPPAPPAQAAAGPLRIIGAGRG